MTALTLFDHAFEGKKITTIVYKGKPCWLAKEVGEAIGYAQKGKEFVAQLQGEWSNELMDGHDFMVLKGHELQEFKALAQLGGNFTPSRAPAITLLYESGLWLALTRTGMDAGKRLRRFLVDNVLPQIARDGRYSPEREVTREGQLVAREAAQAAEDRRLAVEREKIDVEKRKLAADGLWRLCDVLKDATYLGDDIKKSLAVAAAEEASGRSLAGFLPPADPSFQWESPTQIAERMGVTVNAVGKAITTLGLRGAEGLSRAVVNKAQHSDRTVVSYLYSPEAVARIEEHLDWRRTVGGLG
jgi:prophage antirepressor-like protein